MSKRIDDKTLEKFGRDVKALRSIYTDAKIAEVMKTNSGNFSSRVNGVKRPGQDFIDRFYAVWGEKLKGMMESERLAIAAAGPLAVNDQKKDYSNAALRQLDDQDERLRYLEKSISRLDSVVTVVVERLLESNQKLIDAHLSILKQLAEKATPAAMK